MAEFQLRYEMALGVSMHYFFTHFQLYEQCVINEKGVLHFKSQITHFINPTNFTSFFCG